MKARVGGMATMILLVVGLFHCNTQPDQALCGRYYRGLLNVQTQGPRAVLAALQTSQGKDAVMQYCMGLTRYQVECSLSASSPHDWATCETAQEPALMDRIPWPDNLAPGSN